MADPLSIIASTIAVIGATGKASKGLEELWSLRRADSGLLQLMNEVCCDSNNHEEVVFAEREHETEYQISVVEKRAIHCPQNLSFGPNQTSTSKALAHGTQVLRRQKCTRLTDSDN